MASQRAWLLLALGANPGPAVRLAAPALHLDVKGDLAVRLESADGESHRVRLRALTARGLRAEGGGAEVAVPAKGTSTAALALVRAGAPRGSGHAVLLVADTLDGPLARAAVLAVPVEVAADPSLLPRLRGPLLVLGLRASRGGPGLRGATRVPPAPADLTPVPTATYGVDGMEKPKDYYELLGVPRDASLTAIKRAFRRLARRFDPGRVQEATDAIAELQAAYETLSDAERRRSYDDELGGADRSAPVDWSFVRRPAAGDLRRPFAPTSLAAEILLKPEEAAAGTVVSLDVPVTATCDACGGTGGSVFDCGRCQGEGKVARRLPVPVHVPAGLRDGAVFQVRTDDPAVPSILLTVHLRRV